MELLVRKREPRLIHCSADRILHSSRLCLWGFLSGVRESNSRFDLGKIVYCHYTNPAFVSRTAHCGGQARFRNGNSIIFLGTSLFYILTSKFSILITRRRSGRPLHVRRARRALESFGHVLEWRFGKQMGPFSCCPKKERDQGDENNGEHSDEF